MSYDERLEATEKRLARIEARLVQLMLHFHLDPYSQTYQTKRPKDNE